MSVAEITKLKHYAWCDPSECWEDGIPDGRGGLTEVAGMGHQSAPITYEADGYHFEVLLAAYQALTGDPDDDVEPYIFLAYVRTPDETTAAALAAFSEALERASARLRKQQLVPLDEDAPACPDWCTLSNHEWHLSAAVGRPAASREHLGVLNGRKVSMIDFAEDDRIWTSAVEDRGRARRGQR